MTAALLALLLSAAGPAPAAAPRVAIKAEPAQLVLGKDASAELEVTAAGADGQPLPDAKLLLSSSVGEVSPAIRGADGRFKARFLPPKEKMPSVALILAELQSGGVTTRQWLALPLLARANLKIETKPRAQVTVTIGAANFGPVVADGRGNATVPAVVPPGIPAAEVRAVDRAGNSTVKPLDLLARPFPLVRAVLPGGVATWAGPARIEAFAVSPEGKPLTDPAALKVSTGAGKVDPPVALGNGVFGLDYRAPEQVGGGKDAVSIAVGDKAPPAVVTVKLAPGAPAKVKVELKPGTYVAGSRTAVWVSGFLVDARGNPLPDAQPVFSADFGALEGKTLKVPDSFGGRKTATVHATAGNARGEAALALEAGPPVSAKIAFDRERLTAGESLAGAMSLADGFGNPVEHARATVVASSSGRPAQVQERGEGRYAVRYDSIPEEPWGPESFEVKAADATLGRSAEVTVLPYRRPWAISVGLLAGGQTTAGLARAVSGRALLGLRLGRTNLDVIGEVQALDYATVTATDANNNPVGTVHIGGLSFTLGLAYAIPAGLRTSLQFTAVAGVQGDTVTVSGQSTPSGSPVLRLGAGPILVLGPGHLVLRGEYSLVPVSAGAHGGLGGAGLAFGYVLSL